MAAFVEPYIAPFALSGVAGVWPGHSFWPGWDPLQWLCFVQLSLARCLLDCCRPGQPTVRLGARIIAACSPLQMDPSCLLVPGGLSLLGCLAWALGYGACTTLPGPALLWHGLY